MLGCFPAYGWEVQGSSTDHFWRTISVLTASHGLLCSSLLQSSSSGSADLLVGGGASRMQELFLFQALFWGCMSYPTSFLIFSLFLPSFSTQCHEVFLTLSESWGLSSEFNKISVWIVPHVDGFSMYLWEYMSLTSYSSIISPPSIFSPSYLQGNMPCI